MRTYTFEAKEATHTLKYGYNAICDLEESVGKPIQVLFSEESVGLSTIRMLLWTGLRWKNNGLTKQQVGLICEDLIENGTFQEVGKQAVQLLANSLGKGDGVGE